jgi:hypothetical protein
MAESAVTQIPVPKSEQTSVPESAMSSEPASLPSRANDEATIPESIASGTTVPTEKPEDQPILAESPLPKATATNGTNSTNGTATTTEAKEEHDDTPLFSPSYISPEVAALLPEGYSMRPLRRSDYHKGKNPSVSYSPRHVADHPLQAF